jgi:predicted P-loop ATPase
MLAVLGGPYFAELTESLDTKDFFIVLQSKWLIEVAELDAFRRSDVTRIKQLLTSQKDRCRLPYTRRAVDMPRRVIFAGSTNETAYLQDATGARRFWPVKADVIDLAWLRGNREQLFAEAVARFDAGEGWWEVPAEAAREQTDMRRNADVWETRIADYCVGKGVIEVSSVLEALGVEIARQGKPEQMRAASALRLLGYHRAKKRFGTVTRWVWMKTGAEDEDCPF